VINASNLTEGSYIFGLWASDLQVQVPCIYNVTIVANQVVAVTELDFEALFTFYAGDDVAHPCSQFPPQPSISVNGSYSYSTAGVPLSYSWTQTDGLPLLFSCDPDGFTPTQAIFNTSEPVMQFVPPSPGWYCFQLVVSDGVTNSTPAYICVQVQPDFGQPNSTLTPIVNYTPPPLNFFTPPPVPHIPFENATIPPLDSQAPVVPSPTLNNTHVPPMFPTYPPMSPTDVVAFIIVMAWCLVVIYLSVWFINQFLEVNEYAFLEKRIYGGSYSRLWNF
jgi:hypothetical protein